MLYEIEAAARLRRVSVTPAEGALDVSVDGRIVRVHAVRVDAHRWSLLVDDVRPIEAVVGAGGSAGELRVRIGAVTVPVVVNGRRHAARDVASRSAGPLRMTAPMPGRIARLLVNVGDRVVARQPLVVVEAMKMENELRALRDGTIVDVPVRQGQTVEAGTLLVVLE